MIYKGRKVFASKKRGILQTTSGTATLENPVAVDDGPVIADSAGAPSRPGPLAISIDAADCPAERLGASLSWVAAGNAREYDVQDAYAGTLLASNSNTSVPLCLPPDVLHALTVTARGEDDLVGEPSEPLLVHRDTLFAPEIGVAGPQVLTYRSPLTSWHRTRAWTIRLTTAGPGVLNIVSVDGNPPVLFPGARLGSRYVLSSDAVVAEQGIELEIPFECSKCSPRLYNLTGGAWVDITTGVDPAVRIVSGRARELGIVMVVEPARTAYFTWWGAAIAIILVLGFLRLLLRRGSLRS